MVDFPVWIDRAIRRFMTQPPPARAQIFLVEDHQQLRTGVAMRIQQQADLTVCGEAEDADTALSQIIQVLPDLVLLDLSLKNSSGFHLLRTLQCLYPGLPVLVLSMHAPAVFAKRALAAGARGYLSKQQAIQHLVEAIRVVLSGRVYLEEDGDHCDRAASLQAAHLVA